MDARELLLNEFRDEFIYRFVGLDVFLNILLTKTLTLVKPDLWEDPYEMYLLKKWVADSIVEICKKREITLNDYYDFEPLLKIEYMVENLYAQCWSLLPESDALWRIYYNGGKTLRLKVKLDQIKRYKEIIATKVTYSNDLNVIGCISDSDLYKLSSTKREAFSHEQEVRLIYNSNLDLMERKILYARFLEYYKDDFLRRRNHELTIEDHAELYKPINIDGEELTIDDIIMYKKDSESTYAISIDPKEFFVSVYVSPFAPKWFCDTVNSLCNVYGIEYAGQSTLYSRV